MAAVDTGGPDVTADTRTFERDPAREALQQQWLERHIPGFLGPIHYTKTCLYDMPPDRNFVLDAVPGHPDVLLAAGAGHAYTFAALIGRIMSDLAIEGATSYPIASFAFDRPAITDLHHAADYRI